jgi:hypothetical protein
MAEFLSLAAIQDPERFDKGDDLEESAVRWALPLPAHLDTEKIQLNMSRLSTFHKVGAFTASIVAEYQGETTESHSVAGINPDGSATAGKSKTIKAPESDSSIIDHPDISATGLTYNYGKPLALHRVNRPELIQNVIERKEKGAKDELAWGKELDVILRGSFRDVARANLKDRISPYRKALSYVVFTGLPLAAESVIETGSPSLYASIYAGFWGLNLLNDSALLKYTTGSPCFNQRRWSLFLDNQPDRYIALSSISRIPGLIKVLP